jgi:hypothetical protein
MYKNKNFSKDLLENKEMYIVMKFLSLLRISFDTTGGSRLMQISLLQISLLQFFKKIHKFALCEFMPYALSCFVSLVRFFGYFCPIWLMRILANANFFQNQKLH